MYPNPYLILTLSKIMLKNAPEKLLESRGIIPNLLSALFGIALALVNSNANDFEPPS